MGATPGVALTARLRRIVQSYALRCRTRINHNTALRHLENLAIALAPAGWRCVRLYRREEFPISLPLLRVYAPGAEDVEIWIHVQAEPHGLWGYYEALRGRGRNRHLYHCGDAKGAAERVGDLLRERMYPSP